MESEGRGVTETAACARQATQEARDASAALGLTLMFNPKSLTFAEIARGHEEAAEEVRYQLRVEDRMITRFPYGRIDMFERAIAAHVEAARANRVAAEEE
jgi:hypothetical protein